MARNKDPAVLLYTDDFLAGTIAMSDAQAGKYIRLLCLQHQQGHLPESVMLKICKGRDPAVWSKFVQGEDGLYFNRRMETESLKRQIHSEKQREKIIKRWDDEREKRNNRGNTVVLPLGNGNGIRNIIPPSLEYVTSYCNERTNSIDPQTFIDFYTAKDWKIGKEKMKDWQAAVRTWEKRNTAQQPKKRKSFSELAAEMDGENT
jgi:uncharacterized protein YdaU (DUF1376 family)